MTAALSLATEHAPSPIMLACPNCGQVQGSDLPMRGHALRCSTCATFLERSRWRSLEAAGAFSAATLLLLIPAISAPLMHTSLLSTFRQASVITCAGEMLHEGWPELAIAISAFVIIFPIMRFGLLTVVMMSLLSGRRLNRLGAMFGTAMRLQSWAMPEVFLLSVVIAFLRLRATVEVQFGLGGYCLTGASICALLTRASLSEAAAWRAIHPDRLAPGESQVMQSCSTCAFVSSTPASKANCLRCGERFRHRRPFSVVRGLALAVAAVLLYLPANLYPIATLPIGIQSIRYTVLQGVIDLAQAKLLGLALIVLTASFVIPILKLGAISWCVSSVLRRSNHHIRRKMSAYTFAEEAGRWSMVDPFLISVLAPVASFNGFIYGRAEMGAPYFTAVVVLTMIAVRRFDPRNLWDAARGTP